MYSMVSVWGNDEKLRQELFKLKGRVTKKRKIGTSMIAYSDVVWFLLEYYKKKEEVTK